jgi:hypothetical protein
VTVSGAALRRYAAEIGCEDPAKSARLAQFTGPGGEDNLETVYVADLLPLAKRLTGLGGHSSRNLFTTHNLRGVQPTVNPHMAWRLIGFLRAVGSAEADALAATVQARIDAPYFYAKVCSTSEEAYTGWVYDLHVPDTQSYVAQHILVHSGG